MLLYALLILPFLALMLIFCLPKAREQAASWVNLGVCAAQLLCLLVLWPDSQAVIEANWWTWASTKTPWLALEMGSSKLELNIHLVLDALNAPLLLLNFVLLGIATWISKAQSLSKARLYHALIGLLNITVVGSLLSFNFLLFYVFFELMLVPLYFLIGIWGMKNRVYAAVKLFAYTLLGSLLLLGGGILLAQTQSFSFDWLDWYQSKLPLGTADEYRHYAFWLILIGFGIKLPFVPFHTWLPDAHVQASTPVSVLLAGIVLKIGGYGLLRFCALLFPEEIASHGFWLALWGIFSVFYASMAALGQHNFKSLVAYSSVGHLGFVLLGIGSNNVLSLSGASYQMLGHGLVSALLFILAGSLQKRGGSLEIKDYSGLWIKTPWWAAFMAMGLFAAMSLPLSPGFIAEILVLLGSFKAFGWTLGLGVCAAMLFSASYGLWAVKRLFFGPYWQNPDLPPLNRDMPLSEKVLCVLLLAGILSLGLFPFIFLDLWAKVFGI
ncbi:MAG: NADH-quinone oxidoreductase subunit M [Cytophagales bacterium]|nr:MAG: NADH-quinone oxidoreductase subunit M [Cytophagales bacterium]TAF60830.1 MAG: NADH-quinone oxidoreductase subunit M [Cytophagales bacterium]